MIEIVKINLEDYGIFHCLTKDGIILREVNEFLIELSKNGGRKGNKLASKSQKQYSYVMKRLFDYFEKNLLKWNKIEKNHIHDFIKELDLNTNTSRKRINYLTNIWVQFYSWCQQNEITTNLRINFFKNYVPYNQNDELLAHTRVGKRKVITSEFTFNIPQKNEIRYLSIKTVKSLFQELKEIDVVFYCIAYFMVTSGLRINGALQLKENTFPHYLEIQHLEWLSYEYIPKGNFDSKQTKFLTYPLNGWKHISKTYMLLHNRRAEKYFDITKKWTESFFVKNNGKPVLEHDVWYRFRQVSRKLKMKITPHMLRHTYAVLFVLQYSKKKGIEPTSKTFFWDVHKQLQRNLGHVSISTTMYYCEAAYHYTSTVILDDLALDIAL